MAKFGSIKYQVVEILKTVNGIGESKKASRESSGIKSVESGHKVSDKIHSYKSMDNMRNDLINLGNYAKENFGVKDISQIHAEHVREWLNSKEISYATASNYISELNKVADNFCFSREEMKVLREELKELPKADLETRAYKGLEKIELRPHTQPAFELQRDYGLRANASTHINLDKQLIGNTLSYQEKGGKWSEKELSPSLVSKLKENAPGGKYEVNNRSYSRELKKEIEKTGQVYNGTHGIRHSYAQKCLENGMGKSEVSQEMGHTRAEITNIYLR